MSDYNFLMESRLSPEQYAVLVLISRLAAEQGLNLYLVGGAVRDLTYGQQVVRDLDFALEGSPQKVLRMIPVAGSAKPSQGGRSFSGDPAIVLDLQVFDEPMQSSEVRFANGVRAELATSREATYPHPGEAPEIRPAAIFEDLKRRDFSLNAMAVSLHPNSRGLLLDPTNGAGDIERRELRALHSRTFTEDPSRIYRALRLAMRLDFKLDERTQRWLDQALEDRAWERIDAAQQARELAAILHEDQPGRVLKMLAERKLLSGLDKKLASVHLPYERFTRIRNVLQNVPGADAFLLNFHALIEKVGGEYGARLARKIIGDNKAIKLALSLDHDSKRLERTLASGNAEQPSQVYALLEPEPQPLLLYLLATTSSAKVQNRIKNHLFKFPLIRARLPRTELQSLGVKAGPEFDGILEQIFALQLDGKIHSHQQLMMGLRELAGIKEPPPPPPSTHVSKKGKLATPVPADGQPARKGKGKPAPLQLVEVAKAEAAGPIPRRPKKGREGARHSAAAEQPVAFQTDHKLAASVHEPAPSKTKPQPARPAPRAAKPPTVKPTRKAKQH